MSKRGGMGWWETNTALALAVMHDRTMRRRVILRFLALLLGMFAVGLWVIDGWLAASVWRFLIFWGACAALTVFVMLFALYDALAAVREEREVYKKEMQALREQFTAEAAKLADPSEPQKSSKSTESGDSACDGEE